MAPPFSVNTTYQHHEKPLGEELKCLKKQTDRKGTGEGASGLRGIQYHLLDKIYEHNFWREAQIHAQTMYTTAMIEYKSPPPSSVVSYGRIPNTVARKMSSSLNESHNQYLWNQGTELSICHEKKKKIFTDVTVTFSLALRGYLVFLL